MFNNFNRPTFLKERAMENESFLRGDLGFYASVCQYPGFAFFIPPAENPNKRLGMRQCVGGSERIRVSKFEN